MMEMKTGKQARPVFRVLAAILGLLCLLALAVAFLVEGAKSWKFLVSGTCFFVLMVYVAATGRAPRSLR